MADPADHRGTSAAEDVSRIDVRQGHQLPVRRFFPESGEDVGTVVILSDVFGWGRFYEQLAARLTTDGFAVAVPDLFSRVGELPEKTVPAALARRERLDEQLLLDDLGDVITKLATEPRCGGRVATLGFCFGGTLALRLAPTGPAATVSFYGFPTDGGDGGRLPSPLELAPTMRGPILGLWGDEDEYIPVGEVRRLDDELTRHAVTHEFQVYSGEGHNFLRALFAKDGSSPAALDAWERTTALLADRIRV
jgi:carboxymethylenebutenolidase